MSCYSNGVEIDSVLTTSGSSTVMQTTIGQASKSTNLTSDLKEYSIHVACKFGPVKQSQIGKAHAQQYVHKAWV